MQDTTPEIDTLEKYPKVKKNMSYKEKKNLEKYNKKMDQSYINSMLELQKLKGVNKTSLENPFHKDGKSKVSGIQKFQNISSQTAVSQNVPDSDFALEDLKEEALLEMDNYKKDSLEIQQRSDVSDYEENFAKLKKIRAEKKKEELNDASVALRELGTKSSKNYQTLKA